MKKFVYNMCLAVAVLMLSSCVKESRDNCPCYLNFAHEGFDNNGYLDDICLHVVNGGSVESQNIYRVEEMIHDICDVGVRRGYIDVYGIVGMSAMNINQKRLTIPLGKQCDPIWAFYDDVAAWGERALVYGKINKQHAKVRINLNMPSVSGFLAVKVIGNTCGMDMQTMEAIRGEFVCLAENWESGLHVFRVPRQVDNSLLLEIWQVPASNSFDINMTGGRKLSFLEIGMIISDRLGYNWNEESLRDIDINIDYVKSMITIKVQGWIKEEMYSIDI